MDLLSHDLDQNADYNNSDLQKVTFSFHMMVLKSEIWMEKLLHILQDGPDT